MTRPSAKSSSKQTTSSNDPGESPGWRGGLSDSPSSLLSQQGPGGPAHLGGPGAPGGHARPSGQSLRWDPVGRSASATTVKGRPREPPSVPQSKDRPGCGGRGPTARPHPRPHMALQVSPSGQNPGRRSPEVPRPGPVSRVSQGNRAVGAATSATGAARAHAPAARGCGGSVSHFLSIRGERPRTRGNEGDGPASCSEPPGPSSQGGKHQNRGPGTDGTRAGSRRLWAPQRGRGHSWSHPVWPQLPVGLGQGLRATHLAHGDRPRPAPLSAIWLPARSTCPMLTSFARRQRVN